jgi:NADH dehydrogenase [ubiquinone] 1 alpha subcomplex assembly factor 7
MAVAADANRWRVANLALAKIAARGDNLTAMSKHLAGRIYAEGPITVAEFMAEALYHPVHGYYMTRDPFGSEGDFTTAPEISQMFGELVGVWCVERWQAMRRPESIHLLELGPGRGTMMCDVLRAASAQPEFVSAVSIHLVEVSAVLRERQRAALVKSVIPVDSMHWHSGLETLPSGPLLVFANEFLDALPIQQFERTAEGWCERLVTKDETGFHFLLSALLPSSETAIPRVIDEGSDIGAIFETRPDAIKIARQIAAHISQHGGAALFIDYGHEVSCVGDTLQAVRGHAKCDLLSEPGSADLTAHVDFDAFGQAACDLVDVHGPVTQGNFLKWLGIDLRAENLARNATKRATNDISAAYHRLVDNDQMGSLFKVIALTNRDIEAPPGFTDAP